MIYDQFGIFEVLSIPVQYRIIFILIGLFSVVQCASVLQMENVQNGQLRWSDFTGKPDTSSTYDAVISSTIDYAFRRIDKRRDTLFFEFLTWPVMYKHLSWVKDSTYMEKDRLLNHEQGHYYIATIHADSLLMDLNQATYFRRTYDQTITEIVKKRKEKLRAEHKLYDKLTNHGWNSEYQESWDLYFKKTLHLN